MKTEILDQIINILQEKDDFLITSHLSPDGCLLYTSFMMQQARPMDEVHMSVII